MLTLQFHNTVISCLLLLHTPSFHLHTSLLSQTLFHATPSKSLHSSVHFYIIYLLPHAESSQSLTNCRFHIIVSPLPTLKLLFHYLSERLTSTISTLVSASTWEEIPCLPNGTILFFKVLSQLLFSCIPFLTLLVFISAVHLIRHQRRVVCQHYLIQELLSLNSVDKSLSF